MGQSQILAVNGLGRRYGSYWAVKDVCFTAEQGDILGILGENGAGKSTLLSMLAALMPPTEGTILFEGEEVKRGRREYRTRIGYVPQEIALFEELSGWDNLKFFARGYGIPKQQITDRIAKVCAITAFQTEWLKRSVSEYSGGMKRKINIGAALLHQPTLLLLDEPTANLDFRSEEQIMETIKALATDGVTVVYVGHQPELMEQLCNKFCLLKGGQQLLFDTMEHGLRRRQGERISLKQLYKELGEVSYTKEQKNGR